MKVLILYYYFGDWGGAGAIILNYATFLKSHGHEITVACAHCDKNQYPFPKDITIVEIGGPYPYQINFWLRFKNIMTRFIKKLECFDLNSFDIINAHSFPSNYIAACLNTNAVKLFYCHEPYRYFYDEDFLQRAPILEKYAFKFTKYYFQKFDQLGTIQADFIAANSKYTANFARRVYGVENIHVLYPLTNFNIPKRATSTPYVFKKILDANQVIMGVGIWTKAKGIFDLFIIFRKIINNHPNTRLILVGKPPKGAFNLIQKLMRRQGIPSQYVEITGFLDEENYIRIFKRAVAVLYPSHGEPFGLVPVEAMSMGTPVVAYEGGPSESIIDNITGFIIPDGDIELFASKIGDLIDSPEKLRIFRDNCKKHVKQNWTFTKHAQKFEDFLVNIINVKKPREISSPELGSKL